MKRITSYLLQDRVFIQGYAIVADGGRMMYGEVLIENIKDYIKLGVSIIDEINKSGEIIIPPPTREDYKAEVWNKAPIVQATGMKTWSALEKKAKRVDLDLDGNKITMVPMKYGTFYSRRAHIPIEDKALTSPLDPETLGRTLIQAFELCE